jgi:hypothetical protein
MLTHNRALPEIRCVVADLSRHCADRPDDLWQPIRTGPVKRVGAAPGNLTLSLQLRRSVATRAAGPFGRWKQWFGLKGESQRWPQA